MTPSPQQEAIFADVAAGSGHTVVRARAGTGKTSTIVASFAHLPKEVKHDTLMVAFNKEIATELSARAPNGVHVSTLHSYGLRQLSNALSNRPQIDQEKLTGIIGKLTNDRAIRPLLKKAISLAKGSLAHTIEPIDAMLDQHGFVLPEEFSRDVFINLITTGLGVAREDQSRIDFDDMIWMPNVLSCPVTTYRRVFVDETQDLNPAQIRLALKACHKLGRITAVGDDRQAIYGFRGAGRDSLEQVISRLEAKVLGLTTTYRCAKSITREAAKIVPDFCCPNDAPDGVVESCDAARMMASVRPGDFILSRTNAPLLTLCFRFIKTGQRVAIAGRDIGTRLRNIIVQSRKHDIPDLLTHIELWRNKEVARLEALERDCTSVHDTADCVISLSEGADSIDAMVQKLDFLFDDSDVKSSGDKIVLSSTHKAKGLERDRVFLLRDTYLRGRKVDGEWQPPSNEELNLYYVAVTRARRELYLVEGKV